MADDEKDTGGSTETTKAKGRLQAWLKSKRGGTISMVSAIVVMFLVIGVMVYFQYGPPSTSPEANPTPTTSSTDAEPPDVNPSQAPPEQSPDPSASPTEQPTYEGEDGDDAPGEIPVGERPPWEPSGDREPQDGDEAKAEEVLEAVLPAWATMNTAGAYSVEDWTVTWAAKPESSRTFMNLSIERFPELWSGAIAADVSVTDARIVSTEMLWNVGSDSLWRVQIERDLEGNHSETMDGTETVTWDFQVIQHSNGAFELLHFNSPKPENEDPSTYRPE